MNVRFVQIRRRFTRHQETSIELFLSDLVQGTIRAGVPLPIPPEPVREEAAKAVVLEGVC
jgi:hypothetical protein